MLKVSLAHSLDLNSSQAAEELIVQSKEQIEALEPRAGLLFAGIDHDFSLILDRIYKHFPKLELIGCSTDGELSSIHGYTEDSVVLMLFCSDNIIFKSGVVDGVSKKSFDQIREQVDITKKSLNTSAKLCLVTPTGLTASGDNIIEGFQLSLGKNFPIFGGTAGDLWRFERTYQFQNNNIFLDAAPYLLIGGSVIFSFGVDSGWIPIGKKAVVTKSEENVVYKIEEEDALEFYKHHLGESIGFGDGGIIGEYPLAIFQEDKSNFYLRAPIFDAGTGSLRFVGNVPQGSTIQITHTTRDKIVEASKKSVSSSVANYRGKYPVVAMCFSCAARKQVLGTRVKEEFDAFKVNFPDVPVIGFYSYGEIGPLAKDKPARFHNETFFNLLIGVN